MGRRKTKTGNPLESMDQLISRAVGLFEEPYDDREGRDEDLPSVRFVAEEMNTTILRVRKLLITAKYYSTEMSRKVQDLYHQNRTIPEIMEATGLGQASVYSYLPYLRIAWNLDQATPNAERLRVFRQRKNAVEKLMKYKDSVEVGTYLWNTIKAFEGYPFSTAKGLRFSYVVKRGKNGLPTSEIIIDRKEKTITKSTIFMAFYKAVELQKHQGYISGPKQIGGFGASYLYPMFLRFGMIRRTPME